MAATRTLRDGETITADIGHTVTAWHMLTPLYDVVSVRCDDDTVTVVAMGTGSFPADKTARTYKAEEIFVIAHVR